VLVEPDGRVVACGGYALVDSGRRADMCWGMVRQDLHGRGLGRLLTEARMRRIHEEPTVREVALNTSQFTSAFYERMGFQLISVERDGYSPGLDRCEMRFLVDGPATETAQ
jgi:N-acetylglutamate synthase-like GNAT family acetyltransferase